MGNLLDIKNLSKTYRNNAGKEVLALNDLSLAIPENKLTILIGQTGCGKTTLLNLIAKLDSDFAGKVVFAERESHELNISFVFQHYTLFPWRNIINNVAFSLEVGGVSKKQRYEQAEDLLMKVGLNGFEKSFPHELSGGMRQRAAIAQALAKKPDLLLLDEPFGALDDATRQELQQIFLQLMETEKITTVLVTHNIEEALIMGDYVCVFTPRPGKVTAIHDIKMAHPRKPDSPEFNDYFIKLRHEIK